MAIIFGLGLSVAQAETKTYTDEVYRVADTPNRYGFPGLYMINNPNTREQGKFGLGLYWEMSRFCLPGDPRYPRLQEISLVGGYAITDKLEVAVSAPFRLLNIPSVSSDDRWPDDEALEDIKESGFSNVSVGLRYNIIGPAEGEEGFALTPYVLAFLPTASDPEAGTGADNTRIHIGATAGLPLGIARLYAQAAYQIATAYDQDEQNFTERGGNSRNNIPHRPRFEYFGTNPLFHEYGNTLFYGGGLAVPLNEDDTAELFSEFLLYHSFDDPDYIPLFEDYNEAGDYEALDVVQDGGMAHVGAKIGFGNGITLTGGWGAILFAEEPMYESPHWRVFAGLTYHSPTEKVTEVIITPPPPKDGTAKLPPSEAPYIPPEPPRRGIDCDEIYEIVVNFEFDKATLTPEGMAALDRLASLLRQCPDEMVEVQGHTDWDGTENYNMKLGARRARAVVYYLVYDQGIDPSRVVLNEKLVRTPQLIAGETYGESMPVASNESDAGRAQNRRVQFVKMGM
jgi:outer membrane protein OmpA-like peptidoglycan-associated protein